MYDFFRLDFWNVLLKNSQMRLIPLDPFINFTEIRALTMMEITKKISEFSAVTTEM